nr:unnamed protein product [Callosobruchus analis]
MGTKVVRIDNQQLVYKVYTTASEMFAQLKTSDVDYNEYRSLNMRDIGTQTPHNPDVVLGDRRYPLYKSRSTHVTIVIYPAYYYTPGIKLMRNKDDAIVFSESEWNEFLDYQNSLISCTQRRLVHQFIEVVVLFTSQTSLVLQ